MTASIEHLGDEVLLLRLGDRIDADLNAQVHALAAALDATRPPWVRDIVPAYATLAVFVDVPGAPDALARAEAWLMATMREQKAALATAPSRTLEIPVHFGGDDGPDLALIAGAAGLSESDAVDRFCAPAYQVAMLGFAPGFPYLLGLDPVLAMARMDTPRTRVAAGSVGIGGAQAGIYPREGPGGWRIVGRTPRGLFDAERDPPALLAPGDKVRFVAAR